MNNTIEELSFLFVLVTCLIHALEILHQLGHISCLVLLGRVGHAGLQVEFLCACLTTNVYEVRCLELLSGPKLGARDYHRAH